MDEKLSLQQRLAPRNACFGCGPANEKGLQIQSFVEGDRVVCRWQPQKHHEAFDGVLSGGIIGTLMDCHSNWCAIWTMMQRTGSESAPCTVTAEFAVKLLRPTPLKATLHLRARPVEIDGVRAVIDAAIEADGKTTATCRGTFVAVREGHPAYHRW